MWDERISTNIYGMVNDPFPLYTERLDEIGAWLIHGKWQDDGIVLFDILVFIKIIIKQVLPL